jgi:hypothetical protein
MALAGALLVLAAAAMLGRILLRRRPAPFPLDIAAGAPALMLAIFALMALGFACPAAFAALGVAIALAWARFARAPAGVLPLGLARWMWPFAAAFALLYFVHALAPEIQTDAVTYHLALARAAFAHGGFPREVTFYNVMPLGVETLFAPAYAMGGATAAKLLHFGFLLLSVPLIAAVGQRLGFAEQASCAAAVLYLITPVGASADRARSTTLRWFSSGWRRCGSCSTSDSPPPDSPRASVTR